MTLRNTRTLRTFAAALLAAGMLLSLAAPATASSRFVDVPAGTWFTRAVDWMDRNGVTTGVGGSNRFEPGRPVTRAEFVTFLWRANGEQPGTDNEWRRFGDVSFEDYYKEPVDWAASRGITTGYGGSNRFEPHRTITRAEAVTMLYRYRNSPLPRTTNPFVDVHPDAYFADAVRWALDASVTTGIGGTNRFDPHGTVTRAQAATFIYRLWHPADHGPDSNHQAPPGATAGSTLAGCTTADSWFEFTAWVERRWSDGFVEGATRAVWGDDNTSFVLTGQRGAQARVTVSNGVCWAEPLTP